MGLKGGARAWPSAALFILGLVGLVEACGGRSQDAAKCSIGAERCACTTGGACNTGLSCESMICVRIAEGGTASGGPSGEGGPGSSGGDATVADGNGASSGSGGGPGGSTGGFMDASSVAGQGASSSGGGNGGDACATTTLTGHVFDPAGQLPLADAFVFVPIDPTNLPPIQTGTRSCDSCGNSIVSYVTVTRSDPTGIFTLTGVPSGPSVPIVVQVGKWRHLTYVAVPNRCGPNSVADGALRLPRGRSEGDLPQMAVVTGGSDDLGCFLRGIGLAPSEYGAPASGGRLDVYQGVGGPGLTTGTAGACSSSSTVCPLYASKPALEAYDIVLLACEGGEHAETKPSASLQFMHDWLSEGGKVFATHFQYYWFKDGPTDFQNVATWTGFSSGIGTGNYTVDNSFAAGERFDQWLTSSAVGAATGTTIALNGVADSVSALSQNATQWVYDPNNSHPKYMSFLTPIGGVVGAEAGAAPTYCGRSVFSDLHTSGSPSGALPDACPTTLTSQQKALEYLFFELSACVGP